MNNPKILVGVVTADAKRYCVEEFKEQLKSLNYDNYDVYIVDNSASPEYHKEEFKEFKSSHISRFKENGNIKKSSELLAECQNEVRRFFLAGQYEYLLNLESDVFVDRNIIPFALSYDTPVYTASYMVKTRYMAPALCVQYLHLLRGDKKTYSNSLMLPPNLRLPAEIKPISNFKIGNNAALTHTGIGCTLIRRDVLEAISFRTSDNNDNKTGRETFSDTFFFIDCLVKKIEVLFDNRYICKHLKNWNMDKNELNYMNSLIVKSKEEVKEYKEWALKLRKIEKDKSQYELDRFNAFKERTFCDSMIVAITNQLGQYAKIIENVNNQINEQATN